MRVGEKEISEQAAIVARYADLFTREQLTALREAERGAGDDERERLYRLRKTCEGGIVAQELAERDGRARERRARRRGRRSRARRCPCARRRRGSPSCRDYADREELGDLHGDASAALQRRPARAASAQARRSRPSCRASPTRSSATRRRRASRCAELAAALAAASAASARPSSGCASAGSNGCSGPSAPTSAVVVPRRRTCAGCRRSRRPTRRSARPEVCLDTLQRARLRPRGASPNIRPDLDDRPQKTPRACVIASDPPSVVHLITRAQGGLHDYQAFLHEAGHALHYAGCDPTLPFTFRRSRATTR